MQCRQHLYSFHTLCAEQEKKQFSGADFWAEKIQVADLVPYELFLYPASKLISASLKKKCITT